MGRTLESHLVVQKDLNISEVDACRIRQPARLDDLAELVHILVVVPTRSNAIHRQPHQGTCDEHVVCIILYYSTEPSTATACLKLLRAIQHDPLQ